MYRKFSADKIFNGYSVLPGKPVIIIDKQGLIQDLVDFTEAGDDVEHFTGMITPGFINAHCHAELSHLKGQVPEGTGLVQFVQQVMNKRTQQHSEEQKAILIRAATQQMHNSGIVAVGDICNTADSLPAKKDDKMHWHNFIEVTGFIGATAAKRLADLQPVKEQFVLEKLMVGKQKYFNTTLAAHAPYSVSQQLFQLINNDTAAQLTSIHNQETAAENDLYQTKSGDFLHLYQNIGIDIDSFEQTGKSSLQSWFPYFSQQQKIIAVHNNFTNQSDLDFVKKRTKTGKQSISFCICINANRYIEKINPPIELLVKNNCNIILGTDSLASNHQLSIWEEIKTIKQQFQSIHLETMLQWATSNGATALQMDDIIGTIEKGKQPGLVLIDNIKDLSIASVKRID